MVRGDCWGGHACKFAIDVPLVDARGCSRRNVRFQACSRYCAVPWFFSSRTAVSGIRVAKRGLGVGARVLVPVIIMMII